MIRNIHYRIFFQKPEKEKGMEVFNKLKKYLKNNWAHYPPHLGHANLLAEIDYIGEYDLIKKEDKAGEISTVIPVSVVDNKFCEFLVRKVSINNDIPIAMELRDKKIINVISESFIIPPKEHEKIKIKIKPKFNIYTVDLNGKDSKEPINIIFIPISERGNEKENIKQIINI
jgi:hypothetical protein